MQEIDALEARILLALDETPGASDVGIARRLGISRNTVHARRQRLEREGLRSPSQRVRPDALGYRLVAFVSLAISQQTGQRAHVSLTEIPEVVEIHAMTGEADLLVKVLARDTDDLHRITHAILAIGGVVRSSTAVSLAEVQSHRIDALLLRRAVAV